MVELRTHVGGAGFVRASGVEPEASGRRVVHLPHTPGHDHAIALVRVSALDVREKRARVPANRRRRDRRWHPQASSRDAVKQRDVVRGRPMTPHLEEPRAVSEALARTTERVAFEGTMISNPRLTEAKRAEEILLTDRPRLAS